MKSADFRNEAVAIVVAVGSAALTFAIVGPAKWAFTQIDGTVLVALMLPPVAYFIASGKLTEFKAPGGIEAKFAETAKTISTTSTNIDALREMQEQNLEALVVVDEQWMLRGVVEENALSPA
jgi:hypothetical protein